MRNKYLLSILLLFIIIFLPSCNKQVPVGQNRVVVAISSDIESTNPLFAFTIDEGTISELLYLSLVQHDWNYETGNMTTSPSLAKSWDWNKDSSSITLNLRDDVKWTDGLLVTARDVVFSFDVYSDPLVQSKLYGSFKDFYTDTAMHVDLKKTFDVINPYKLTINFKKHSASSFYDIDFPIIPEHIYKNASRKDLVTAEKELKPVTDGPFELASWNKNQSIILTANKKSFLYNSEDIDELIFKIVPDYYSQLTQLKQGEIDFMQDIRADDYPLLKREDNLILTALKGREYDYIGWNNLDPGVYKKSKKIISNKLFGNPAVRIALTYAINRGEILHEFLNNHGEAAIGPMAPIFSSAVDTSLKPLPYSPDKAKQLLASTGWKENKSTSTLEKNGIGFSFTLYIPSGNPRREFAATVIQNNLREIGIKMDIEKLEPEVFFQKMYAREFDAWMAGWSVSIPPDLKQFWYSKLEDAPLNVAGYQNKAADKILDEIESTRSEKLQDELYIKLQDIIYKDNPVTFLYWIDNLMAYNKRIKNFKLTPLGPFHRCWEWSVK